MYSSKGIPLLNGASIQSELEPYVYTIKELSKQEKEVSKNFGNYNYGIEYTYSHFNLPTKVYGTYNRDADHMLGYFLNNKKSVGVLITGNTGSGKSLTCKLLCNKAIAKGFPVIMVNGMNITKDIIQYLSTLDNCVIFLDEFGKLTTRDNQAILLQMLTDTNKRIFWLFANKNKYEIHQEFFNRTERIRYYLEYGKITKDVITEYCKDNHVESKFVDLILTKYNFLSEFSFDQLQGLISEHQYAPYLDIEEISRLLNFKGLATEYVLKVEESRFETDDDRYNVKVLNTNLRMLQPDEKLTLELFNQMGSDKMIFNELVGARVEFEIHNKETDVCDTVTLYLDKLNMFCDLIELGYEDHKITATYTCKPNRRIDLIGKFTMVLSIEPKDKIDYSSL